MSHPSLGLPPPDPTAGRTGAAALLRRHRSRLSRLALEAALKRAPHLRERHGELGLRRLLRDMDRHIEQLARALETNDDSFVTNYAEWLVPIYRRRGVPMKDFAACVEGLRDAIATVLADDELEAANRYLDAWIKKLVHHRALPGDHKGNPIVRFFWKGAGILDDSTI